MRPQEDLSANLIATEIHSSQSPPFTAIRPAGNHRHELERSIQTRLVTRVHRLSIPQRLSYERSEERQSMNEPSRDSQPD
jgi:hypothetical protein